MEKPITFENKQQKLYGILHEPDGEKKPAGVIFLHGWGTYRIGPHRFFVEAAREFAKSGFTCLRFDFRGRGESEGKVADTTLPDMIDDAHRAVDEMLKQERITEIVLLGLCSGGEVAVGAAAENPKVSGVVLLSTPLLGRQEANMVKDDVRKTANHARSYWQKLFMAESWKKIFSFRVNYKAIFSILFGHYGKTPKKDARTSFREAELIKKFREFKGRSLFIYGENDPEAKPAEKAYRNVCATHKSAVFNTVPGANHNFYSVAWKKEVINQIMEWLDK